jgi:hypothetical protein
MALILAYKNRRLARDITILDADGITITPGSTDRVRISIGREGETALLTVDSQSPTANGSSLTKGAANRLILDADDLGFTPGTYTMLVDYYDADDGPEWKTVSRQCFVLENT